MVVSLDANVIKVAVPAIGRGLGASVTALQWTLTSYLLTVAAPLLLSGALADRFGRRRGWRQHRGQTRQGDAQNARSRVARAARPFRGLRNPPDSGQPPRAGPRCAARTRWAGPRLLLPAAFAG
jgi:Major Facilitator Superfamily